MIKLLSPQKKIQGVFHSGVAASSFCINRFVMHKTPFINSLDVYSSDSLSMTSLGTSLSTVTLILISFLLRHFLYFIFSTNDQYQIHIVYLKSPLEIQIPWEVKIYSFFFLFSLLHYYIFRAYNLKWTQPILDKLINQWLNKGMNDVTYISTKVKSIDPFNFIFTYA